MCFIFVRFPVAIWNFLFLRIFSNRISTAREIGRQGQYHTDALVDNAPFKDIHHRSAEIYVC